MNTTLLIILVVVINIPVFMLVGWVIFKDWEGFWEAIKYWIMPDWISMLRGEYFDDFLSEAKLLYFAIVCGALVFVEYLLYQRFFGS